MRETTIVVDTSAIIAIGNIHRLDLLRKMYKSVYIPNAVLVEVGLLYDAAYDDFQRNKKDFNICVTETMPSDTFPSSLHQGEIEVIQTAEAIKGSVAVLDDQNARKEAKRRNIPIVGTLGILMKAKQIGIVSEVKPLIDLIRSKGFYISDIVYETVIRNSGESI